MGKQAGEMSVAELVAAYNDIAKAIGAKARKNFKSKAEGLKALEELDKKAKTASPTQAKATEKKAATAAKVKASKPKTEKSDKPKKPGVGAFCKDLIQAGKTNEQILDAVAKKFPDANTKNSSIAFYRHQLKNPK